AAVLVGDRDAENPGLAGLGPELSFDDAVLAPGLGALGRGMLGKELGHPVAEDAQVLVGHVGRFGDVQDAHGRSRAMAVASPPPMQREATPRLAPRASRAASRVAIIRAPEAPI